MWKTGQPSRQPTPARNVSRPSNSFTGALTPISLTSVDQSGHEMGVIAAQLLLERIRGRSEVRNEVFTPRLVV
ncbi:hypothetical protein [Streptomyces sp. NPDC004629]|uniref:hypothetical protein n=1 Tax=Streptomyces sp. NPDC004629 TaxID=3364705 RepID=UPI00367E5154